ncbi:unnamed protein product [Rotaria sp. Silwood1]|nr:unnamed protein product [Rotaria sp. Silwood1]
MNSPNNTKPNKNNEQITKENIQTTEIIEDEVVRHYQSDEIKKLIENLIKVCEDTPGLPLNYLNHIIKFYEIINSDINKKYQANDINKALMKIQNVINSINCNENKVEQIQHIMLYFGIAIYAALQQKIQIEIQHDHIKNQQAQIRDIISDIKNEDDKFLRRIKDFDAATKDLLNEIKNLQKNSSDRVLNEVHGDLLMPLIERIEDEFNQNNKEKRRRLQEWYDVKKYYRLSTLERIKSGEEMNDEPIILINKILQAFCNEAELSKNELLELVLHKIAINYESHGFIENYLYDVIHNHCKEHDFIRYIENENHVTIIITDEEKDVLMKLVRINIALRRDQIESTIHECFDDSQVLDHNINGPLRIVIIDRYKEKGTIIMGKVISGYCHVGDQCLIMPNRTSVEVTNIYYEDIETNSCVYGQNVRLKLRDFEDEEILPGFILCNIQQEPCSVGLVFDAQVTILEHKSIIRPGYSAVLHIHAAVVEVQFKKLITLINRNTGERTQEHPRFIKQNQVAIARFELSQSGQAICMEPFKRFPQLGRFTLRNEGRTIAIGKVLEIIE